MLRKKLISFMAFISEIYTNFLFHHSVEFQFHTSIPIKFLVTIKNVLISLYEYNSLSSNKHKKLIDKN